MTIQRILALVAGKIQEYVALQASAGAASAGSLVALNNTGTVDVTMLPSGVGPDVQVLTASEAIAAGAWVNVWSNAGAFAVRNADGRPPASNATAMCSRRSPAGPAARSTWPASTLP